MTLVPHEVALMIGTERRNGACPRCHGYMVPIIPDSSERVRVELCEWSG